MPFLLAFSLLIFSQISAAQVAVPSIFPEIKSINPAIIYKRDQALVKLTFQEDFLKRVEGVVATDGSFDDNKYDIEMKSFGLFAGCGANDSFSYEAGADYSIGEQLSYVKTGGVHQHTNTVNAEAKSARFAFGFYNLGIELRYIQAETENEKTTTEGGVTTVAGSGDQSTALSGKLGLAGDLGPLHLGIYGQYDKLEVKDPNGKVYEDSPDKSVVLGAGFGFGGPDGVIEASVEGAPFSNHAKTTKKTPYKASLRLEKRLWVFRLGLKSMVYGEYFEDIDQPIQNQLVYRLHSTPYRFENELNFGLVGSDGFNLSGSAYYSKSDDTTEDIASGTKTKMSNTGYGYKVGISYNF